MDMLQLQLSLEQEFALMQYEKQVTSVGQTQAQELLIEAFRQLMIKDNVIRALMKAEIQAIYAV
jgi:Phycobilisome degradation protein nblA